jgi:hypothetical protein
MYKIDYNKKEIFFKKLLKELFSFLFYKITHYEI